MTIQLRHLRVASRVLGVVWLVTACTGVLAQGTTSVTTGGNFWEGLFKLVVGVLFVLTLYLLRLYHDLERSYTAAQATADEQRKNTREDVLRLEGIVASLQQQVAAVPEAITGARLRAVQEVRGDIATTRAEIVQRMDRYDTRLQRVETHVMAGNGGGAK